MNIQLPTTLGNLSSTAASATYARSVASPWRRLVAALIDAIVIGLPISLLAWTFFDLLVRAGAWCSLIGLLIAIPDFPFLNSRIANGQTIGKRLMHLQVVDANGVPISFARSALRYAVLFVPFLLDALVLPTSRTPQLLQYVISTVVLVVGGATFYLILFNRHTRQGAHDLAAKSFVADSNEYGQLSRPAIWTGHWVILGALLSVYFVCIFYLGIAGEGKYSRWSSSLSQIESLDHVSAAGVSDLTWYQSGH